MAEQFDKYSEQVRKLESDIRKALNVSSDSSKPKDKSSNQFKMEKDHQMSKHIQKGSSDDCMLLQTLSSGRALQGILLTNKLEDQLEDRKEIIDVPENVFITGAAKMDDNIIQFSSVEEENTFKKCVDILGWGLAVSMGIPKYGEKESLAVPEKGMESTNKSDRRQTYASIVKYTTIQMASYSFNRKDLKLSADALCDLHKLKTLIDAHGSSSNNVRKACEMFFKTYGSHVNQGPLKFGGNFCQQCSSKGFYNSETQTVKTMQSAAVSVSSGISHAGFGVSAEVDFAMTKGKYSLPVSSGVSHAGFGVSAELDLAMTKGKDCLPVCSDISHAGFGVSAEVDLAMTKGKHCLPVCSDVSHAGFGVSAEVHFAMTKGKYIGKCSDSTLASTHMHVVTSGGPPEATDLLMWKRGLIANKNTWILTSRGEKLIPVWNIVRRNHQTELTGVVDVLRDSWEKMTGLVAEQDLAVGLSYSLEEVLDEVCEWNEEDLSTRQIEDNVKFLQKVKQDIIDTTGAKSIWLDKYLLNSNFQKFLLSIVSSATPQNGHIKYLMQSLIQPGELKQFDMGNFPNIDLVNGWLYEADQ